MAITRIKQVYTADGEFVADNANRNSYATERFSGIVRMNIKTSELLEYRFKTSNNLNMTIDIGKDK